jgi:hypothetical protein
VLKVRNQEGAEPALQLRAALMLKTQLLYLRFRRILYRLFIDLGRLYRRSRLLRIASLLAAIPVVFLMCGIIYVSYNRTDLPDLDAFIRFEPPSSGHIYDTNGHVLIELGTERREIIQYNNIPKVLRQAILSAEDENFFSHSGVDYSVFPRLLAKTNIRVLMGRAGVRTATMPLVVYRYFPKAARRLPNSLCVVTSCRSLQARKIAMHSNMKAFSRIFSPSLSECRAPTDYCSK